MTLTVTAAQGYNTVFSESGRCQSAFSLPLTKLWREQFSTEVQMKWGALTLEAEGRNKVGTPGRGVVKESRGVEEGVGAPMHPC